MIIHIVLLRFKADSSARDIQTAFSRMSEVTKIDGVLKVSFGADLGVVPYPVQHAFKHGSVVQLRDRETLLRYGPDPIHQALAAQIMPLVAESIIVDIEV
jgi:hypothetical protein